MQRKTFDTLVGAGGFLIAGILLVAGGLLMWGFSFTNNSVHSQLAKQQITFAALGSKSLASNEIGPYLDRYAGQQLVTGPQAKAYADHFIAVHLSEMPYAGVYSKASAALQADPTNAKLAASVQTIFQGTTLRGLLLEAYAFWTFGQIALISAIAAFSAAAVMILLSALGLWHVRRVSPEKTILEHRIAVPQPAMS
jgi:hypothetical protein